MQSILFIGLAYAFTVPISVDGASSIRPVSVFPWTAPEYHRYSAVLAATEPYRLQRADDVRRSLGAIKYLFHRIVGSDLNDPSDPIRKNNFLVNRACTAYENKAREIIRAYGLDPSTFHNISQSILKQPRLRQQVALQTYYYRIAADLEDNITPIVSHMPDAISRPSGFFANPLGRISALASSSVDRQPDAAADEVVQRFSRSIAEVEKERKKQLGALSNKLGAGKHMSPELFCSQDILPLMSRDVQKAYASFPLQASRALRRCGVSIQEFNYLMNTKMKLDSTFRRRVDAAVGSLTSSDK